MADTELVQLESSIKDLPGVLGCVILSDPEGAPTEIQAFTGPGTDRIRVERAILEEVGRRGLSRSLDRVFVFELEPESHIGDRESLERAAELAEQEARARGPSEEAAALRQARRPGGRTPVARVDLRTTAWASEAEVALGSGDAEVVGEASGERTSLGLRVLAEATLGAVAQLVPGMNFSLRGASLVSTFGRDAVLVLVAMHRGPETLGAALVRDGPVAEAGVRATLDAVNRRLERSA